MSTGQNYDGRDNARPDSVQTGQKSPQSVNSDQPSASRRHLPAFEVEVSLISQDQQDPTEAYLILEALHALRDSKLNQLREEYRYCRKHPGQTPDLEFVQRTLNVIVRLNTTAQLLVNGLEHGYRALYVSLTELTRPAQA